MSSQEDAGTEEERAERRRLRKQQRSLHDEILDNRVRLTSTEDDLYADLRLRNNEMFQSVKHCREQHLDAENLKVVKALFSGPRRHDLTFKCTGARECCQGSSDEDEQYNKCVQLQ